MPRLFLAFFAAFLVFTAAPVSAINYNFRVKLADELGNPLSAGSPPTVSVSNCANPVISGTRVLGNGVYEFAILTDTADSDCVFRVTSPNYLFSAPLATGNLQAGIIQDKTAAPIVLTYRTKIIIVSESGAPVTDAVIHHGFVSPAATSGNAYYFTTSGTSQLIIERPGFVTEDGTSRNSSLKSVSSGSSDLPTTVELTGFGECAQGVVAAGSSTHCAGLTPTTAVTVKDEMGLTMAGAAVRLWTDVARTTPAVDLNLTNPGAIRDTDSAGQTNFALTAGTYYYRADRLGRNDANGSFVVSPGAKKEILLTLAVAGANVVSPGRSTVLVYDLTAPADNATAAKFTVNLKDGNGDALGANRSVTAVSSRPLEDKVTPEIASTDTSGRATFSAVSSKAGKSVFIIKMGDVTFSTFPTINFYTPPAALADQTVSKTASKITVTPSPVSADGQAAVTVTVMAANAVDVALKGKTAQLVSSRGSAVDAAEPALASSGEDGTATFTVKSKIAGTALISATIDGVKLDQEVAVTFSPLPKEPEFAAGDLIKAPENPAVYYYASNGKRYVFPDAATYFTWYADFSSVKTVTDAELAAIPLAGGASGNVTYKPGIRLVKIQTDSKVYAVAKGGTLRWITSEAVARLLYGQNWAKQVSDVPDAFFTNYVRGADVVTAADYDIATEKASSPDIGTDKGL